MSTTCVYPNVDTSVEEPLLRALAYHLHTRHNSSSPTNASTRVKTSHGRPAHESGRRSKLTQDGHHLVVLDDLEGSGHHEAQAVHALPRVVDQVSRGAVDGLELHGQRAEAPVAGQPEGRVLLEDLAVQMDTDVRPHVLRADLQYLEHRTEVDGRLHGLDSV